MVSGVFFKLQIFEINILIIYFYRKEVNFGTRQTFTPLARGDYSVSRVQSAAYLH